MTAAVELKDIVSMVVCGLCDLPKNVEIRSADIENKHVFITVIAHKSDIKRIVGKEGRNISALRHLAQAIAAKHQQKTTISIDE
jgi:predicted RNA-binding protein YlqC (UPF0109 family)